MVRGIASFFVPPPQAAPAVQAAPAPPAYDPAPGAFASLFAREYLTWQAGHESERAGRLQGLLAAGLDSQAGWVAGPTTPNQTVEETWPFAVERQSDTHWLVTVGARVSAEPSTGPVVRTLYLAIPVQGSTERGFAVSDYPAAVPPPETAKAEDALPGDDFTDADGQIHVLLTGFFKAYAAGGPADVAYFLEPGVQVRGLQGAFTFSELVDLKLRRNGQESWASVLVSMHDPVTSIDTRQRFTLQLTQKDGRWYIKQIL
jgi:hypothetical protein